MRPGGVLRAPSLDGPRQGIHGGRQRWIIPIIRVRVIRILGLGPVRLVLGLRFFLGHVDLGLLLEDDSATFSFEQGVRHGLALHHINGVAQDVVVHVAHGRQPRI